MNPDANLDPKHDSRNVIDSYKGMSINAIRKDMGQRAFPIEVAIENFQHDYNIGSIVRTANACNVAGVHIVGKRHWNRRGAMATEKYLQLYHHKTVSDFAQHASGRKLHIIGVDNIPGSIQLSKAVLPGNAVYVFGQEGPGLSEAMQQKCEQIIAIEQFGSTRSVNVGVASGIVLYEWLRRNILNE